MGGLGGPLEDLYNISLVEAHLQVEASLVTL